MKLKRRSPEKFFISKRIIELKNKYGSKTLSTKQLAHEMRRSPVSISGMKFRDQLPIKPVDCIKKMYYFKIDAQMVNLIEKYRYPFGR